MSSMSSSLPSRAYMKTLAKDSRVAPGDIYISRRGWRNLRALSACKSRKNIAAWFVAERTRLRITAGRTLGLTLPAVALAGRSFTVCKAPAPLSPALAEGTRARLEKRDERVARNAHKRWVAKNERDAAKKSGGRP